MKITKVTPLLLRPTVLVRIDTDVGIVGWGECSPMNGQVVAAHVQHSLAPLVVGRDPFDVEAFGCVCTPHQTQPLGTIANLHSVFGPRPGRRLERPHRKDEARRPPAVFRIIGNLIGAGKGDVRGQDGAVDRARIEIRCSGGVQHPVDLKPRTASHIVAQTAPRADDRGIVGERIPGNRLSGDGASPVEPDRSGG